ncbi:hypothetical protein ESCO_002449 [Escovopsis weberi]|uniref:Uncharacterized protein n=1 Tax=Escovopsis weberi TaxID=150374 RepID=A0A0M8MW37_ESCWE|nr:hypothetical protein ESCO_002449 [Escovopsis weberi]
MVLDAFHKGMDGSPASCLAMLICALGCIATPFGPSDNTKRGTPAHNESQVFFHAAQRRIGMLLVRSDIIGAQCLFLSGIYLMMVFQPIYAWRFFSQALATCQHLPFLAKAQTLRSSPGVLEMGPQDTQEQAVYWSAWKSERELRQELELPDFVLSPGHTLYPPFFPAPPSQPANPAGVPGSEAERVHSSWMFYLAEISLRRLTSRLSSELIGLRDRYASSTPRLLDVLADMMPEYETQVQEWSNSLPADLSLSNALDGDGICRSVLRGRMINLLEMIYWPFVMAAIDSRGSTGRPTTTAPAPAPAAAAAEELARRGLDTHVHQIDANRPGFRHRHHGGYFMIRSCTRSALVLVAAARAGCAMPPAWSDAIPEVIGMLSYWEDEDADVPRWKATLERALAAWRRGT